MARVFSALPARALRARPPLMLSSIAWGTFAFLMFGMMLAPMVALAPPVLITDWQVRGAAVYVRGGTAQGSSCSSRDLIEICDMTLSAPANTGRGAAGQMDRRVYYTFLSSSDRPQYRVVADPAHPEWLTTDVALELFWNRVVCCAGATLLLALLVWILVRGGVRGWRRRRAWRGADALAVPLRLVSRQTGRGGQFWTVQGDDGPPERWQVPRRAAPFVLGSASEVLGLRRLDGTAVMPLDSKLRWVNLTAAERALVLGPAKR